MSSHSNYAEALVKKKRMHESHKIQDIKMINKEIEDKQMELEKMKNTKKKIETEIGRLKKQRNMQWKNSTQMLLYIIGNNFVVVVSCIISISSSVAVIYRC